MSMMKHVVEDVMELMEAGLNLDQIVECTDYPVELVRKIFEQYGFTDMEMPVTAEFEDVPF